MKNGARPKANRQKRTHRMYSSDYNENKLDVLIKDLTAFEEFKEKILPAIRKDLASGLSAKELREKYAAMVQARVITEAITNPDAGKATAAAVDLINRVEGKATEKKEVTHKFKDMKDEELDAILKSEIEELEDMEQRFEQ